MYVLREAYLCGRESDCSFVVKTEGGGAEPARFRVHLWHGPPARLRVELRGIPAEAEAAEPVGAGEGNVVRFESAAADGCDGGKTVIRRWPRSCCIGAVAIQVGSDDSPRLFQHQF